MKFYTILFLFYFFYPNLCEDDSTDLQLLFIIFRHGERIPETNEFYPYDPHPIEFYKPLTYGDITKEGKHRQYHLGKKLRQRYNDFFGDNYSSNSVAAYTTNWIRTKTSLLLTLAGMFPPQESDIWDSELKWNPIPYYYAPSDKDHIIQRPDPYCPKYMEELNRLFETEEVKNITKKYQPVFDYVTKNSGRDMFDHHEMLRIYQNVHYKNTVGLDNPEWVAHVYPEPLQTVASYQCLFENYTPLLRRLNGGHLLQKIIELSKKKQDGTLIPQDRKLFLLSGHENNIVNILAVLGLYNQHIPPYCSAVIIEVHKEKSTNRFGFKILYENDTYTEEINQMTIPNCTSFCPIDTLVELAHDVLPVNYTAECGSDVDLDNPIESLFDSI